MEIAAAVDVTLDAAEDQSGGVRGPAQGALTLEARAAAALAFTALVVAPVGTETRGEEGQDVQDVQDEP